MIWLLRFQFVGRTWYLASESCAPVKDGVAIPHHGTLTVGGFAEGLDIGGGVSGPCTAEVGFTLDLDGWNYIRDGHRLDAVRGEVSLWRPGTDYAARYVLLFGRMESDDIPRDGEPFKATITQRVIDTAAPWPDPNDLITLTAWPDAPNDSDVVDVIGLPYPWPVGILGPFTDADGTSLRAITTPVIVVDATAAAEVGCIAGAPVVTDEVRIWNRTQSESALFTVSTTTDGEGQPRATVDLTTAPVGWVVDGTEEMYVTDWLAGGIVLPRYSSTTPSAAGGLGDVLLFLLQQRYDVQGGEAIDFGAWSAAANTLNGWRIGYAAESGDPMDTITGRLLPLCPNLWIVGGPHGWRPIYLEDTPGPRCKRLEAGRDVFWSEEPPGFCALNPVNTFTVQYAYGFLTGNTRATVTMGPSQSTLAAASVTRHGQRTETLEALAVYDRGTAALAASETIRFRWTKPIYLVYDAPSEIALNLTLGQRVRLVDASLGLGDVLFYILCRETEDGETWQLTLFGCF